jgi:hypothetical protein
MSVVFLAFIAASSAPADMAAAQMWHEIYTTEADCRATVVDIIYLDTKPGEFVFCREFVEVVE